MHIYNVLKENADKLGLIFPEEELKYNSYMYDPFFENDFINYFSNEFKKLKIGEVKKYLLKTEPELNLFMINNNYLIHSTNGYTFNVFDKNFREICFYSLDEDEVRNPYLGTFRSTKTDYFNRRNSHYTFEIKPNSDLSILISSEKNKDKNTIKLYYKGTNQLESIQFLKDHIEAKFKSSFYQKMKLDHDLNILSIDFSSKIKKELNIKAPIKNIKNYQSLIKSLETNFDLYNLINDSKFNLKLTESEFKKHASVIEEIVNKKDNILNFFYMLDDLNIKPSYQIPFEDHTSDCRKYLNTGYYDIVNKGGSDGSDRDYIKGLLSYLFYIKENNINPIDNNLVEKLERIHINVDKLYEEFGVLKKTNKELKKIFSSAGSKK